MKMLSGMPVHVKGRRLKSYVRISFEGNINIIFDHTFGFIGIIYELLVFQELNKAHTQLHTSESEICRRMKTQRND